MTDQYDVQQQLSGNEPVTQERREFLRSLGKWSQAVIGGVVVSSALIHSRPADAWAAARGAGGGTAAVGARGGWVNGAGGGGWANRAGGGGGAWVNRYGGGGGSWINR